MQRCRSVSEGLIHMAMRTRLCRFVHNVCISGVQPKGFNCTFIQWAWLNYPLSGGFSIASVQLGMDYCLLYGVAGCPLFRVSAVKGCPLRWRGSVAHCVGVSNIIMA